VSGVAAEGGGGLLWVMITSRSWKVDVLKERAQDLTIIEEEGNKARFGICPWEAMWYPPIDPEWQSIRFEKKPLRFRANFERCRCVRGVFGGWEDFIGRARIVGNAVVRGLE
jgi:hypothetical protein